MAFRLKMLQEAKVSAGMRADIVECCQDPLWWLCALCWLYEPRPKGGGSRIIPFIPWEHQIPIIEAIKEYGGHKDVAVEKSRGEGMSWIACLMALHEFLFAEDLGSVGLISMTERAADNPGDMDSLMEKLYWEMHQLPQWLAGKEDVDWKRNRSKHLLLNMRNNFTVTSFAATADVASGGRKTFIIFDELAKFPRPADEHAMASTQHVTDSRIFISTPKGTDGAYYDVMHDPNNMVKKVLDWKKNPSRNRGLYKMERGKPVAVDPVNNPLPHEYDPPDEYVQDIFSMLQRRGFKLEGVLRSPWYDNECARPGATPQNIAQELDRSYGGSMHRVFPNEFFERTSETTKAPMKCGNISINPEKLKEIRFDVNDNGPVSLWCPLDLEGNPPDGNYAIGVDICTGIGGSHTSNSIISVVDIIRQEQVLEFYSNSIAPPDWAEYAVAIAHWFGDAYLAWEHNGPGSAFTKRVLDLRYGNIYRRKNLQKNSSRSVRNKPEPGWLTTAASKEVLFGEFIRLVVTGEYAVRSKELARECGQYIRENGKIKHVRYADEDDGNSHGDRTIAFGIALQATKDRPIDRAPDRLREDRPLRPDTMAARMAEWEAEDAKKEDPWDSTTLADMTQTTPLSANDGWY